MPFVKPIASKSLCVCNSVASDPVTLGRVTSPGTATPYAAASGNDAFAMHDLPAHPGEEISADVLYGTRQRIWDQAENRRHAQKALLELLVVNA